MSSAGSSSSPQQTPFLTVVCRDVSPSMENCELTCIDREKIDVARVQEQHANYAQNIAESSSSVPPGAVRLIQLPALSDFQDAMFVEDPALVFDECAVLTNPGAASRRGEVDAMAETLTEIRGAERVFRVQSPGTIEGGDTLVVGKYVFVGDSTRTNKSGFEQLESFLKPFGYHCFHIPISKCLHLKSAASMLDQQTVLVNKDWIEPEVFTKVGLKCVFVDGEKEPHSANVLSFRTAEKKRTIFIAKAHPVSVEVIKAWIASEGRSSSGGNGEEIDVKVLEVDEIAKAEGALTCCSLLCYNNNASQQQQK